MHTLSSLLLKSRENKQKNSLPVSPPIPADSLPASDRSQTNGMAVFLAVWFKPTTIRPAGSICAPTQRSKASS